MKLIIHVDESAFGELRTPNVNAMTSLLHEKVADSFCGGNDETVSPILWGSENSAYLLEVTASGKAVATTAYCKHGDKKLRLRPVQRLDANYINELCRHYGGYIPQYAIVDITDEDFCETYKVEDKAFSSIPSLAARVAGAFVMAASEDPFEV